MTFVHLITLCLHLSVMEHILLALIFLGGFFGANSFAKMYLLLCSGSY